MPDRPTVVVVVSEALLPQVMPEQARAELAELAEVQYRPLAASSDVATIAEAVGGAKGVITSWGSPQFTGEVIAHTPNLAIIGHAAGSVRPIVTEEALAKGIAVVHAAAAIAPYVGEMALGLAIAVGRRIPQHDREIEAGRWGAPHLTDLCSLFRARIGLVGFGLTGQEFAKLLEPFGAEVLAYDPYANARAAARLGVRLTTLEEVLSICEIVSLHAANVPQTRHLLNAERLAMLPDGAILINTARGALIDEAALIAELRTGRIWAGLDVTDPEPPAPDNELRRLPNVVMTPHISGPTPARRIDMGSLVVAEFRRFFADERPQTLVTPERFATMA